MGNTYNFKVGFQPFNLMPPAGTPAGMESYIWTLEECSRLGARAVSLFPHMIPKELSADTLSEMAGIARERDVELLLYPFTVWGLAGLPLRVDAWGAAGAAMGVSAPDDVPDKSVAAKGVEKTINMAQALNSRFLCGGYGHNNVATSRYNKQYPFSEQRKFITANLKEMARIIEGLSLIHI